MRVWDGVGRWWRHLDRWLWRSDAGLTQAVLQRRRGRTRVRASIDSINRVVLWELWRAHNHTHTHRDFQSDFIRWETDGGSLLRVSFRRRDSHAAYGVYFVMEMFCFRINRKQTLTSYSHSYFWFASQSLNWLVRLSVIVPDWELLKPMAMQLQLFGG